jgi:hypothetical protein
MLALAITNQLVPSIPFVKDEEEKGAAKKLSNHKSSLRV